MINFENLAETLSEWLNTYYPEQIIKYNGKKILHIDGKAIKAATKKSEGESLVYLMNSMYEGGSISLYTEKIGDKENEITFIPKYLKQFDLKDTIVTIDAISFNKTVIDYIVKNKGFCIRIKKQSTDFKDRPLKRMLVSGCINPEKISKILFIDIA